MEISSKMRQRFCFQHVGDEDINKKKFIAVVSDGNKDK
jgi:hypothetical protein